jgi:hypothetical protein
MPQFAAKLGFLYGELSPLTVLPPARLGWPKR